MSASDDVKAASLWCTPSGELNTIGALGLQGAKKKFNRAYQKSVLRRCAIMAVILLADVLILGTDDTEGITAIFITLLVTAYLVRGAHRTLLRQLAALDAYVALLRRLASSRSASAAHLAKGAGKFAAQLGFALFGLEQDLNGW